MRVYMASRDTSVYLPRGTAGRGEDRLLSNRVCMQCTCAIYIYEEVHNACIYGCPVCVVYMPAHIFLDGYTYIYLAGGAASRQEDLLLPDRICPEEEKGLAVRKRVRLPRERKVST